MIPAAAVKCNFPCGTNKSLLYISIVYMLQSAALNAGYNNKHNKQ